MPLTIQQWHKRYQQQAKWTENLRKYIYGLVQLNHVDRILEIGCGTGVLLSELKQLSHSDIFGIDIDNIPLIYAQDSVGEVNLTMGDALYLPYSMGSFEVSLCHFLLLWIDNPLLALREMVRVTKRGGYVIALAEPDYGGRIDYPKELSQLGSLQIESLQKQGANTQIGRELRSLFSQSNLTNVQVGLLGGQWTKENMNENVDLEWEVIKSDLENNDAIVINPPELTDLENIYRDSTQRILYVPTFYAIGMVDR